MIFNAAVKVVDAAVFPGWVFGRVQDTLAIEEEPGLAGVDCGGGVVVRGVEQLLEVVECGEELRVGRVAQCGGCVEGRPQRRDDTRAGDDGRGGGRGDGLAVVVAHDVHHEDRDDDDAEDVVAGTEAHSPNADLC